MKPKISYIPYLINYWTFNGNLADVASYYSAPLSRPVRASFVKDRLGNANAAVYLNGGSLTAPRGVYFSGDFTIAAWVNVQELTVFSSIVDFGTANQDQVVLFISDYNLNPNLYIADSDSSFYQTYEFRGWLELFKWTHVAATLRQQTASIYVNGSLAGSSDNQIVPAYNVRTSCLIGGTNNVDGGYTNINAYLDDLMIFNVALNASKIKSLMTVNL